MGNYYTCENINFLENFEWEALQIYSLNIGQKIVTWSVKYIKIFWYGIWNSTDSYISSG